MFNKKLAHVENVDANADQRIIHDLQNAVIELNRKNSDLGAEQATKTKLLEMEISLKVAEAVKEEHEKNVALSQENAVMKKEISILEKAFENMGFDVKDMKDILDQLVKGIVSKNTINVVK